MSSESAQDALASGGKSRSSSSPQKVLRKKALDLLARREHSVVELQRKISAYWQKKNPDDVVADVLAEVLEKLQTEGLVSDERFTEAFVRYRKNNGYGPLRIQAELRERGVSDKIQASYLDNSLDFGDAQWLEQAAQARCKRFGDALPKDYKEWARQARFLQYRGFTSDQSRQVLGGDVD